MTENRHRQHAIKNGVMLSLKSICLTIDPKLPIEICLCERSEAISVYFDEIATYPMGARDDWDSVFLTTILGIDFSVDFLEYHDIRKYIL
jgi:hypothetical protein